MRLFNSFTKSLKSDNIKIAFYIWVFNLAISLIAIYAFWNLFSIVSGKSNAIDSISSYHSVTFLIDVFITSKSSFLLALSFIILLTFFFLFLSVFVSGGIYSVLINNEIKTFKNLLNSSLENFFRFLLVFLINLLGWVMLVIISAAIFYPIRLFLINTGNETLFKFFLYFWISAVIVILIIAAAVYDFSRIFQVKTEKNFFNCYRKGFIFVITHKQIIFSVFIIYILVILLFHIMQNILATQIENSMPILLFWLVYQFFIILKYFMKAILMNIETNLTVTEKEI